MIILKFLYTVDVLYIHLYYLEDKSKISSSRNKSTFIWRL